MKRRQMLAAIAAAAAAPAALAAEATGAPKKVWPKVPEGWYGEGMYQDLAKDGTGVTAPGTEGLPTAYIALINHVRNNHHDFGNTLRKLGFFL